MDKQFWISVKENNFVVPTGHAVMPLTEELFSYIGSTDPELRDTIGLEAFDHWLEQGFYSMDDVRGFIPRLIANLQKGLGKTESDSVFLHSFSALWLGGIVLNDNEKPALKKEDITQILEAALAYFAAERDLRGYVPVKGWAHAIAHSADLFHNLAGSVHTDTNEHIKILNCIASKLKDATDWIYLYGEDSRLARPVMRIFERGTLNMDQVKDWLAALSAEWDGAYEDETSARVYFNSRGFLRALRISLLEENKVPNKETILKILQGTMDQAKPWLHIV